MRQVVVYLQHVPTQQLVEARIELPESVRFPSPGDFIVYSTRVEPACDVNAGGPESPRAGVLPFRIWDGGA